MQTSPPLVTIVTPCLNMESYIAKTIESVLSQDYPQIEYILVDGGSPDRTTEVICAYLAKNPDRRRLNVAPGGGVGKSKTRVRRFQRKIATPASTDAPPASAGTA